MRAALLYGIGEPESTLHLAADADVQIPINVVPDQRRVVRKEIAEAASLKIEGTPTFVIGKTTPEGVDGVIIVGALPFAAFDARLKELEPAK